MNAQMNAHKVHWRLAYRGALLAALAGISAPVDAADGPTGASALEEVIVTARKREESLMDAPVAVSAFSGDTLDFFGISDIERLDQVTPNLVLERSPTNSGVTSAAAYIRGVGQNDYVPVIDPGVGIYVDGVYLGRTIGAVLDLVDVERVEILRGPQGTLFGRNTIGGAISLTTRKPEAEFGGEADVKIGTDDLFNARGTVNLPLSETVFARFSVASFNQDGYVTRVADGLDLGDDDTVAARAALRWLASDTLEFNLSYDYSRDRENGPPLLNTGIQPMNLGIFNPGGAPSQVLAQNTIVAQAAAPGGIFPGNGPYFDPAAPFPFNPLACFLPGPDANPQCYNTLYIDDGSRNSVRATGPSYADLDTWGVALTADWQISEGMQLRSITAYRSQDGDFGVDTDGSPLTMGHVFDEYDQDQFSQELQLLGTSLNGRLDWIVGLYYFDEDGSLINFADFTSIQLQSGGFFGFESRAVFAQGTWHASDRLDVTVGLRYTDDSRDFLPDQYITGLPIGPLPGVNCPPGVPGSPPCTIGDRLLPFETVTQDNDETVPMINVAWHWSDDLMTYATYAEGFKSGGFTARVFPPEPSLPAFDPEGVDSWELGLKFSGMDGRLRFSFAAFFTDYSDLQLLVADPSRLGPFVSNAGDAEIKGFEAELSVVLPYDWFVSTSVGLTDADRTSLTGDVEGLTLDSRFEHVSEWTASAQVFREFSLGDWGALTPLVEWSHRSEYGTNSNNVPRDHVPVGPPGTPLAGVPLSFGVPNPELLQDDLHLLSASLRWDVRQSGLALTAGVDNLTDEEYRIFGSYEDLFGWTTEAFDRGRQWYVRVNYAF